MLSFIFRYFLQVLGYRCLITFLRYQSGSENFYNYEWNMIKNMMKISEIVFFGSR